MKKRSYFAWIMIRRGGANARLRNILLEKGYTSISIVQSISRDWNEGRFSDGGERTVPTDDGNERRILLF